MGNHISNGSLDRHVFTGKRSVVFWSHGFPGVPLWWFWRKHLWSKVRRWAFPNIIVFFGHELRKILTPDLDEGFVGIILGLGRETKRDIHEGAGRARHSPVTA